MKKLICCLVVFYCVSISQIHANRWYDEIFAYPIEKRLKYFSIIVNSFPDISCDVVSHRYLGVEYASDYSTSFLRVAVRCRSGNEYFLSIEDNDEVL